MSNINIFNLTTQPLPPHAELILGLGLKFIPPPLPTRNQHYLTALDIFARRLRCRAHFSTQSCEPSYDPFLHIPNPFFEPPTAPAPIEHYLHSCKLKLQRILRTRPLPPPHTKSPPSFIHNRLNSLASNSNLIIKPSDKNCGLVIMDKDYYITECLKILRDTTTYSPQPSPPSPMTLHSHLAKILIKHNTPPSLIKYILHIDKPPRHAIFYILLKLHKNPVVGRPIVSSIGTITFNASRYLDHILQPLMKSSFSFIRNSTDLVTRLEATPFPTSATLCSADVVNLYPSIDLHDGLRMLHIALHISPFRIDNIPLLMDLAQFILFNNYLSFDDQIYLQLQGTAMGTPFAVTFACIYMSMLEIETLRLCRSTDTSSFIPPILLCRFIDDIFSVFQDPHFCCSLFQHLQHPPSLH